jgi:hypothetical protein
MSKNTFQRHRVILGNPLAGSETPPHIRIVDGQQR